MEYFISINVFIQIPVYSVRSSFWVMQILKSKASSNGNLQLFFKKGIY